MNKDDVAGLVERLRKRANLPSTFDFVGSRIEGLFDQENRHRSGAKPIDYLLSWLSMLRPFAYATKDGSWGEMEKLLCIVMRNYIEMSRESGQAADALTTLSARVKTLEAATWKVLAYDQLLRKVGELRAEALLAGDMPNVDAAYDDMVKTCVKALSGKTGDDHGHR